MTPIRVRPTCGGGKARRPNNLFAHARGPQAVATSSSSSSTAPMTGVFQLRPRSRTKEAQLVQGWRRTLQDSVGNNPRISSDAFRKPVWEIVSTAFPHEGIEWSEGTRPERFLPAVDGSTVLPGTEAAERIWRHVAWSLTEGRPEHWHGLHQTVRMALTAMDDALHPESMKTHRTDYSLELCVAALQGMNELSTLSGHPARRELVQS